MEVQPELSVVVTQYSDKVHCTKKKRTAILYCAPNPGALVQNEVNLAVTQCLKAMFLKVLACLAP